VDSRLETGFSLLQSFQTGSEARITFYSIGIRGSFTAGEKQPVRESKHLPPRSVEINGATPPLPHMHRT
jgi:hypothetical protein